jgi:hypothetical protein
MLNPYTAWMDESFRPNIMEAVNDMSDEEVIERINLINDELKNSNELVQLYLKGKGKEKLESREDFIDLVNNFIGSAKKKDRAFGISTSFGKIFNSIEDFDKDAIEDFAELTAVQNLKSKYGDDYTQDQLKEELQGVKD